MPLLYGQDGDRIVVVASRGGSDESPQWLGNLIANPDVEVMVADRTFAARAAVTEGEERERLWRLMLEVYPRYEVYQSRTARQIAVVALTPVES
jgi:deazaflavin-dependent oxidoreductase (nitroreductase family)